MSTPTGTLEQLLQKYELGDTLGTGAFSEVKVATERRTGNRYAVKIIDKSKCKGKESMIVTEVNILKSVRHEHIVQLYEMYEIDGKIYLIMELVTGGELFDDIVAKGKYTEVDTAKIVYKILLAIEYLHTMGIVHRDLKVRNTKTSLSKPENLLLSDKSKAAKVMISDFGLSKIFNDDEVMKTACGTPGYVAPEVLIRKGYGREIDLWSLGVITYILLCGYPPFYDQNNVELFKQIMAGKYEFDRPWWDNISEKAKNFIRHLLVLDPKTRYTARQALEHPFIVDNCGRTNNVFEDVASTSKSRRVPVPGYPAPTMQPVPGPIANNVQRHPTTQVSPVVAVGRSEQQQPRPSTQQSSPRPSTGYQDGDLPGRPLGQKSPVDDSGCVTSQDHVAKTTSQDKSTVHPDVTGPSSHGPPRLLQPGPKSVKLLTYNIFLRPPGIRNNVSDYKNARQSVFGDYCLKQYDIVALQEMFSYGSNRQGRMIQYAKKNGFDYYVSSPAKSVLNAQVDGGLMILSKYPIVKTEKMTYKRGVHADRFSAKGALYAKIALTPTFHIHVFTTHLQSTYDKDVTLMDPSVVVRLNQVAMLKEFMDECTKGKQSAEPIFLMGDMNTNGRASPEVGSLHSEEYKLMTRLLQGLVNPETLPSWEGSPPIVVKPSTTKYQLHDLAYEAYGQHPVTYGDVIDFGSKMPRETVLTSTDDLSACCCLDYVFWLNPIEHDTIQQQTATDPKKTPCVVKQSGTRVEKFFIEGHPFSQISDHYGLCTEIIIN